jgi:hypothetical protein
MTMGGNGTCRLGCDLQKESLHRQLAFSSHHHRKMRSSDLAFQVQILLWLCRRGVVACAPPEARRSGLAGSVARFFGVRNVIFC